MRVFFMSGKRELL